MHDLGSYIAGASVKYRENFHNDTGTLEDPTNPEAQLEKPDGTFTALTAPAKLNAKTGHFGGSIDTTGFSLGQHIIRMKGTVTTAKDVAIEFMFTIVAANAYGYGNRQLRAGDIFDYRGNFHNDTGTLEDPANPEAQCEYPDASFNALDAPAKINAKTGHYGGSVDTTGFSAGQYIVRMAGTVATAKTTAREFFFQVLDTPSGSDPKRQQILDALAARLATILIANGYKTDMGSHVEEWDTVPLDQNVETIQVEYRDEGGTRGYEAVGEHLHTLPVTFRIRVKDNTTALATLRNAEADLYQAICQDVTFGGLAQDANQEGELAIEKNTAGDTGAAAVVRYVIEYTTAPGNPYA